MTMRAITFCCAMLAGAMMFPNSTSSQEVSLKDECLATLKILCKSLLALQETRKESQDVGGLVCPEHGLFHSRAAEALYPFAVLYKQTRLSQYREAAIRLGNWLIRQQLVDGAWKETPSEWTGTTTDQLLMMVNAYPILEKHLSAEERNSWMASIRKAADYLERVMSPDFASINYCATTAASMAMTYRLIPDEKYLRKARNQAHWVVAKMDEDGFIAGEGARERGTKYGVDLGYQMDMSLWGLAIYARLTNDSLVNAWVRKSLENCLYFVYPNGAIDGSWGIRSYKWVLYGSKTADGSQILFSLYAQQDGRYRTAALRNLAYLRVMMKDGLLGTGPDYWKLFKTQPCNYPTFARAKNLALAIELGDQTRGPTPPLPADNGRWSRFFPTVNTAVVRTKNHMLTISAYDYKHTDDRGTSRYMQRPSGGSISAWWVKDHGFFQLSSQTIYTRGEAIHMPELEDSVICLTPRIEFNDSVLYTNLFEFDGRIQVQSNGPSGVVASTAGELKDRRRFNGGVAYILSHEITDAAVEKKVQLRYHDNWPAVRIVEPVVLQEGMNVQQVNARTVIIRGARRTFKLQLVAGNGELELGTNADRYYALFPAVRAYPIVIHVPYTPGTITTEIVYRISVADEKFKNEGVGKVWPSEKKTWIDPEFGHEVTQWTDHPARSWHLYFNVESFIDEKHAIVISERTGTQNFFRLNLESGAMIQITDFRGGEIANVWHWPQFRKLWFSMDSKIYALDIDTYRLNLVRDLEGWRTRSLTVTCDGQWIVFSADVGGRQHGAESRKGLGPFAIFKINTVTGALQQISPGLGFIISHLQASPVDPTRILYCWQHLYREGDYPGITGSTPLRIWWVNIDGTDGGQVGTQEFGLHRTHEFWYPDGSRIGYAARFQYGPRRGEQFIGSIAPDGSDNYMMPAAVGAAHPQVFRDATHWVTDIYEGDVLTLFRVEEREIKKVLPLFRHGSSWESQPSHPHPHFSPDGKQILFSTDRTGIPQVYSVKVNVLE